MFVHCRLLEPTPVPEDLGDGGEDDEDSSSSPLPVDADMLTFSLPLRFILFPTILMMEPQGVYHKIPLPMT